MHLISQTTSFLLSAQPILASSVSPAPTGLQTQADISAPTQISLEPVSPDSGLTRLFSEPSRQRLRRSALAIPAFVIGGLLALFGSGCFLDRSGTAPPRPDGGDGGPDGGPILDASPDADMDGGPGDAGDAEDGGTGYPSDHIPTQSLPADGQLLAPTRAFMSWQDGVIPGGASTWYRSCHATAMTDVDDTTECPNETIDTNRFRVIDPLSPAQSHFWKVQTCYDAGGTDCTDYSPVRSFSTDNSLLGWWRFNEGSGSTASDSSSAGNNGTLTNFDTSTAWNPGLVGGGLSFDGANDFVELGDILNFDSATPFTISAWTNRQSVGADHTIFARADYTDPVLQRGYWFGFSSTDTLNLFLVSDSSTGNRLRIDSTTVFNTPSTPHHVAVTYDGSTMASGAKLFVDGTEETVTVVSDALAGTTLNPAPARIGGSIDTAGMPLASLYNFEGIIDDIAVYNRALTVQEISNETCAREALAGSGSLPSICN